VLTTRRVALVGRTVAVAPLVLTLAAIIVGAWWLWPTFNGSDDHVDVLVVDDGMLADARRSIELRIREDGLSVGWFESSDWCDEIGMLATVVGDTEPSRVVVAFDDPAACIDAAASAIGSAEGVALVVPGAGPDPATVAAGGFRTVDPTRLIGASGGTVTLPCEWWEQPCAPPGATVRDADGRLTESGGERLARMLAATL
jgi:hypothetical protein